jgi:hypothetical protein
VMKEPLSLLRLVLLLCAVIFLIWWLQRPA